MTEISSPLFYLQLSRFHRLYSRSLAIRLSPYDVNPGYLAVLMSLWEKDGITQKQLHSNLDIEQATLSNTLKRMERDELIERIQNPKDKRHHAINLTERGRSIRKVVTEAVEDLRKSVNKGLTINDRRYFKRIMRQMTEQLEDDSVDPLFVLLDEVTE